MHEKGLAFRIRTPILRSMKAKNGLALPPEEYAQLRAVTPEQLAASEARNREIDANMRAARRKREGVTAAIRALDVGASALLEGFNSSQVSARIRNIADGFKREFQSRTERCLITGELRGVRVTRIK